MLKKARWRLDKLGLDHIVEDGADGEESLSSHAQIRQSIAIHQNFLNDKCCHRLRQVSSSLHDSQTERYNFSLEQERNDFRVVNFNESANQTERCQSKVLKWSTLAHRVKEWVQEQSDVCLQEKRSCVLVRSYTLQKCKDIASLVARFAVE